MFLKNFFVNPRYSEKLRKLFELAYNIWSLWDDDALNLFERIDTNLFRKFNKNPVKLLHLINDDRMKELAKDEAFLYDLNNVWEKYKLYSEHNKIYADKFKDSAIAYFSMEFGLHKSIPIYAGGLGILSGDHIKGASDLGIPIIGIGLFYRYGYFDQRINPNGIQEEAYTENNVYYMPIKELKNSDGESVYITVDILRTKIKVKAWQITVGMVKLLLLDTNIEENPPEYRAITNYLYDADRDKRIQQEIILGFGGLRLLRKLNIKPAVFHLNEGHSAFLVIERLKGLITDEKYTFNEAAGLIKSTSIFTTHTPVQAGNENFPVEMIKKYLKKDIEAMGVTFDNFIKYGAYNSKETFWLPVLAIKFSQYINGVSALHPEVSKEMWKDLFPNRVINEVPITNVTNGVHHSWLSNEMRNLFRRYIGPDYIYSGKNVDMLKRIPNIPDEEIWEAHMQRKREMVSFLRDTVKAEAVQKGFSVIKIKKVQEMLDVHTLTIGYARRFATYKRPTLLIHDKERLMNLITNTKRPVQIIFAGKAHPADLAGKNMIKEIIDYSKEYHVEDKLIFIENYNRKIAENLVQGVDVWLNNPIKPMEASGTSGMKAGMNGVLNLSVMDGWWPECYNGRNGWAITAGEIYDNQDLKDYAESQQIYDTLEEEIAPLYYERDDHDIPRVWVQMMKESVYSVYKNFTISRMLSDYTEKFYLPAAANNKKFLKDNGSYLKKLIKEHDRIVSFWNEIYIKNIYTDIDKHEDLYTNDTIQVECYVYLDDADSELFNVELCYYSEKQEKLKVSGLNFKEKYADKTGKYQGTLTLKSSGLQSINVRLVPANEDIKTMFPELIKWKDPSDQQ